MNILCFADTRFPIERANGVQTMATCHALASRGHAVTLVARADTADPPRDPFVFYDWPPESRLRIELVRGMTHPRARRAQFLLAALRRVASTRTGVVLTRDLGLAAFLLQLPARRRLPLVYESHGVSVIVSAEMPELLGQPALEPSRRKLQRLERRERRVWRRAEAYVTITCALQDELVSRYGSRESVFVVPDGVRLPAGDGPTGRRPQDPVRSRWPDTPAICIPGKGSISSSTRLAQTSGIRGLIVGGHPGEPDRARVEALVRDLGLTDRVEITGLVPPADVPARLRAATMLILPNAKSAISERYTSPLKLFEYLALGRPIIASDLPSIREVLTDGDTALLVPAGDPHALATAHDEGRGRRGARVPAWARVARTRAAVHVGPPRRTARGRARGGGRAMISPRLLEVVRCPDCAGALERLRRRR